MTCQKCKGLMIVESRPEYSTDTVLRCINCGLVLDPLIQQNRSTKTRSTPATLHAAWACALVLLDWTTCIPAGQDRRRCRARGWFESPAERSISWDFRFPRLDICLWPFCKNIDRSVCTCAFLIPVRRSFHQQAHQRSLLTHLF